MTSLKSDMLVAVAILIGLFAFTKGIRTSFSSFDGTVYIGEAIGGNGRVPAAIRRDLDLSRLSGVDLLTASKQRLITEAQVVLRDGQVGIELGSFVALSEEHQKKLVCQLYDRILLQFSEVGVAENGEVATMDVRAPCVQGKELSKIEPIWIPVLQILKESPKDMDLKYPSVSEAEFHFDKMRADWPRRWTLRRVKLFSSGPFNRSVVISDTELKALLTEPLNIPFQSF